MIRFFWAEPWFHQYRTSVISGWKTESSGFHRPLLKPAYEEGVRSKLLFFFVAYLPELATDPNTKNM